MRRKINAYHIFQFCNTIFMILIIFVTLYPLYYVIVASFSDLDALKLHSGLLWYPLKPFTLDAYTKVFQHPQIFTGTFNTFFVVVVGDVVNMVLTILGAYFLIVKGPMLTTPITFMIIFTMYFSGGMIPIYLNIRDLGLMDSLWSLILPGALSTSNLIIMRSGFASVPSSLSESATLDGATHFQILTKVIVPLSKATIAVIALYYTVGHWNAWFNASIYIRSSDKYPLQLVMQRVLQDLTQTGLLDDASADNAAQLAEMIKYALIVITTAPILAVYPFVQKYFVKGVMVGAIKG